MKKIILLLLYSYMTLFAETQGVNYDNYLNTFTYEERKNMKIDRIELTVMLEEGSAQLVLIKTEQLWHVPF